MASWPRVTDPDGGSGSGAMVKPSSGGPAMARASTSRVEHSKGQDPFRYGAGHVAALGPEFDELAWGTYCSS